MTARDKTTMPDNAQPEVKAMRIHSDRITSDPRICSGKPCIKGTRIPVHIILDLLAAGENYEGIRRVYPHITDDDIRACISYAASLAEEEAGVLT
jgi:uncharacterized protein (DUF433 family)